MSSCTNDYVRNVAVVIRSSHERTEQLCIYLCKQQVPRENIVVIHERPFSQALRKSFELGLDLGLDWTLCLDADILLRTNALHDLVHLAASQAENVFGAHGRIYDKLFGTLRYAGPHLYRTSLLAEALELIPEADVSLRPETYTKMAMAERGHPWVQFDNVMAIHDFEQYYHDIYRKMVVRANKGPEQVKHLVRRAEANWEFDADFLVCLWGIRVGQSRDDTVLLDARQFDTEFEILLTAHGLKEKDPLQVDCAKNLPEKVLGDVISRKTLSRKIHSVSVVRHRRKTLWRVGSLLEGLGFRFKLWSSS